jgi:hypothetical protein
MQCVCVCVCLMKLMLTVAQRPHAPLRPSLYLCAAVTNAICYITVLLFMALNYAVAR